MTQGQHLIEKKQADEISDGSQSIMVDEKIGTDPTYTHFAETTPLLSLEHVHFPSHWKPEEIMYVGAFATGVKFYDPKFDEYFMFSTRQHRKRLPVFRFEYPLKSKAKSTNSIISLMKHSSFHLAFDFLLGSILFLTAECLSLVNGSKEIIVILQFVKGILFFLGACNGFIEVIDAPAIVALEKEFKNRFHYYRKLHLPLKAKAKHILENTRRFANFSLHQVGFWAASYLLSGVILLSSADIGRFILYMSSDNRSFIEYNFKVLVFSGAILLFLSNFLKFIELTHFFKKSFQFKSFGYWAIVCFILLCIFLVLGSANQIFQFTTFLVQQIFLILSASFTIIGSICLLLELQYT